MEYTVGINRETNPYLWESIRVRAKELGVGDEDFSAVIESFEEERVPVFNQEECLARAEECDKAPNPLVMAGMFANEAILNSNVNLATFYVLLGKTKKEQAVLNKLHSFISYFLL